MARISILEVESPGIDLGGGDIVNQDLAGIVEHRPEMGRAMMQIIETTYQTGTLSRRLMELVRLRIAFHNQCRSCMAIRFELAEQEGVDEDLVCSLERPAEAEDLNDAERAAVRFADLLATNHLAIDEDVYDDLRKYYDEGEIVELGLHCAHCVGYGRLAATWMAVDHVPERFKADGIITPWGGDQVPARAF